MTDSEPKGIVTPYVFHDLEPQVVSQTEYDAIKKRLIAAGNEIFRVDNVENDSLNDLSDKEEVINLLRGPGSEEQIYAVPPPIEFAINLAEPFLPGSAHMTADEQWKKLQEYAGSLGDGVKAVLLPAATLVLADAKLFGETGRILIPSRTPDAAVKVRCAGMLDANTGIGIGRDADHPRLGVFTPEVYMLANKDTRASVFALQAVLLPVPSK